MNFNEEYFIEWMSETRPNVTNPEKYASTIKTISRDLKDENILETGLFTIDNYSEAEHYRKAYLNNQKLSAKDKRGHNMYSTAFNHFIKFLKFNQVPEYVSKDISEIINRTNIGLTEKRALILSRIGQGTFRKSLVNYWTGCCVTHCPHTQLLVASHIKPWKISTDEERLNKFNGLLLTPNLDKVFDSGWISFSNGGDIIISKYFKEFNSFGIDKRMKFEAAEEHEPYLDFHRQNILKA